VIAIKGLRRVFYARERDATMLMIRREHGIWRRLLSIAEADGGARRLAQAHHACASAVKAPRDMFVSQDASSPRRLTGLERRVR